MSQSTAGNPQPPILQPEAPVDSFPSRREIMEAVSQHWILVAACTMVCVGLTVFYVLHRTRVYEADVVLNYVDRKSSTMRGNLLGGLGGGGLGGLASLAGFSIPGVGDRSAAMATLTSRALLERFIEDENLLPVLFPKRWDSDRKEWKKPTSFSAPPPTVLGGYEYMMRHVVNVNDDRKSMLIKMTVSASSPDLAAQWANEIVRRANEKLRQDAVGEAERNIAYIQRKAEETTDVDVRASVYGLMKEQLQNAMIAKGTGEYAFHVIDPAVPPEKPAGLPSILVVLLGLFGGVFVGVNAAVIVGNRHLKGPLA